MKDVSYTVRVAAFKKIKSDNPILNVFVGNLPEDNRPDSLVNIISQFGNNISAKNRPFTNQTLNIECVVKSSQGLNVNDLDDLVNAVMMSIDGMEYEDDNFHLCECIFESTRDLGSEFNNIDKYLRKIVTFDLKIDEKP